jgi:dCMP deaminase
MNKWDKRYLRLAREIATWSKDPSTQVGAVIVRPNKSVCSVGFNGFPQPMNDLPETYLNRDEKYSRIVHAEVNALIFSRDVSHENYTLYTYPFLSCDRCFVQMVQAGITRVVSPVPTLDQESRWGKAFDCVRRYAKECNVEVVEESEDNISNTYHARCPQCEREYFEQPDQGACDWCHGDIKLINMNR